MANMQSTNESTALRLANCLQDHVVTYPPLSEDEPGGYCGEVDQVMDEAAAELRRLHAENTTLQQGYDAARLEIEALRGHGVAPTGEYPPLPEPDSYLFQHEETGLTQYVCSQQVEWGFEKNNPRWQKCAGVFSTAQMRAYVDADRAMREQAALIRPCVICGSDEPFTGACGSSDPRALCKQPPSARAAPQPAPVAQGDALTDSYVQQVPDKCDRIVWRGNYYHLPIDAARAQAKEGASHD